MSRGIDPINSDEPQYVVAVLANAGQNNLIDDALIAIWKIIRNKIKRFYPVIAN